MQQKSIGDALFTKTQQKVLGLLYGCPDETFYMNEIVRLANIGRGTIKRELESMQAAELLTVTRIGNQNHYQANRDCPVYTELLGIVRKTFGIADVLHLVLEPVLDRVVFSFIYGSIAKGTERGKSDIDLMLIGNDLSYAEIMELLLSAEEQLGRPINPTVYSVDDFRKKTKQGNSFLIRLMEQPKIVLKGSEDDVRES
jgi:predicted nucleotidyltransferase